MTCLVAQKPLYEYILVFAGFALLTLALGWVVKEQWKQRREFAPRMWDRSRRGAHYWRRRLFEIPCLLWGRIAHRVTLCTAAAFGTLTLWITGAVGVNCAIYIHALLSGMPRC